MGKFSFVSYISYESNYIVRDWKKRLERFLLFPTFPTSFIFSWEIEETVRKISFVSYISYESFISWEIGRNGEKEFPINLVLLC